MIEPPVGFWSKIIVGLRVIHQPIFPWSDFDWCTRNTFFSRLSTCDWDSYIPVLELVLVNSLVTEPRALQFYTTVGSYTMCISFLIHNSALNDVASGVGRPNRAVLTTFYASKCPDPSLGSFYVAYSNDSSKNNIFCFWNNSGIRPTVKPAFECTIVL